MKSMVICTYRKKRFLRDENGLKMDFKTLIDKKLGLQIGILKEQENYVTKLGKNELSIRQLKKELCMTKLAKNCFRKVVFHLKKKRSSARNMIP